MSMQAILAAGQSMSRMQTMQSARTQMQGKANILRAESKQDGGNEKKEAKADELDEKSTKLLGDLMSEAGDVNETLKPDEEGKTEEETAAEQAEKEETQKTAVTQKGDSLELSDSAARHVDHASPALAVAGEAVIYNANGSTLPSASLTSSPVFEATA